MRKAQWESENTVVVKMLEMIWIICKKIKKWSEVDFEVILGPKTVKNVDSPKKGPSKV